MNDTRFAQYNNGAWPLQTRPDLPDVPENVIQHQSVLAELNALYARKNHDYGDSFHLSYLEEGLAMSRIRLGDKFSRFKTLSRGVDQRVNDEGIRDTLIDLANYAIMTIMELDREKESSNSE